MNQQSKTADQVRNAIDQTFDALVRRLIALGEGEATAAERATFIVNNWERFSDNSCGP
jgi:hypothetical protein